MELGSKFWELHSFGPWSWENYEKLLTFLLQWVWKTHSSHENRHFEVCRISRFHPFPVGFKSLGCAHLAPQVASKRMWRCWIELCSWPRCRAVEGRLPRPWRFSPYWLKGYRVEGTPKHGWSSTKNVVEVVKMGISTHSDLELAVCITTKGWRIRFHSCFRAVKPPTS